ncbi:MAG: O-antigen ligase family protein [Cryomorphaceae bacterium]|nr:O-antigen ligase family protein [Cryomorphaceae bacterium]
MPQRISQLIGVFFIAILLVYTPDFPDPSLAVKWLTITVGASVIAFYFRKEIRGFSWAWIGLIIWLLWQLPLAIQAVNSPEALSVFWKYAGVTIAALTIAALWRRDELDRTTLGRWMGFAFIIVLLSAIFPLLKYALGGSLSENLYKIQGLGGHKNMLTMLLFVGSGFLLFAARYDKNSLLRKLFFISAILALICVVALRTRSLWIGVMIAVPIVLMLYYFHAKKNELPVSKLLLLPIIGIPLSILALYALNINEAADATNLSHRVAFWQKSINMWQENPNGVGPGMWKIELPTQGLEGVNHSVEQGKTQLLRPHNDYLWVLSESGWIGALGYWGFLLLTTIAAFFYRPKDTLHFHFHLAAIFAWLGYLIFSFFDFPLERPEHLFLMLFLAGYFLRSTSGVNLKLNQRSIFAYGLMAVMVASTYIGYHRLQGDAHLSSVILAHERRNPGQLIAAVDETLNPYYNLDRVANSLYYYQGLAFFSQKQLPQAYEAFSEALAVTPHNLPTLQQMGDFFRMCNDNLNLNERQSLINRLPGIDRHDDFLQRAEAFYLQTLRYSPHFTASLLNMADLRLRDNNHHEALGYLSQVYVVDHSNPKFQKLVERAIIIWASEPAETRRRPKLNAFFAKHDPEFQQISRTYSQFIRGLN